MKALNQFEGVNISECGDLPTAQKIDVWILGKFFERILTKFFNDEGNSDRTLASGDRGLRDEISEITSSSEWTEYDLDSESSEYSENEENNPNTINVQLPVAPRRYELRNRKSNEQPCQPHNNATCDDLSENLKRILEDEQEKRLCVVCRDNNKSVLVLPCKHICLCVDCARKVVEHPNPVRRVCPLCRADIETVMNVFL